MLAHIVRRLARSQASRRVLGVVAVLGLALGLRFGVTQTPAASEQSPSYYYSYYNPYSYSSYYSPYSSYSSYSWPWSYYQQTAAPALGWWWDGSNWNYSYYYP